MPDEKEPRSESAEKGDRLLALDEDDYEHDIVDVEIYRTDTRGRRHIRRDWGIPKGAQGAEDARP